MLIVTEIRFAFDVYDFKGDGKVDGFYIGDLLRACNLNPTLATIEKVGGQKEKGKKIMGIDDFYPIFKSAKDSKDTGGIHDFVEILKLYDKNEDNSILGNELFRLLTNLGEKLTKEETKNLMKELCEPEDDEGFMPFMRKNLKNFFDQMKLAYLRRGQIVILSLVISAFLERLCSAEQ